MLWNCFTQHASKFGKLRKWLQDWKMSAFIPTPKKGNCKECSNYCTIALISHAREIMFKILQTRLQQYVNHELPDVQIGFRKGREVRDQIANICLIIEKAREFQKSIYSCFIDYTITFDCMDQNKMWKILEEMGIRDHLPASWETCMQVKKRQLEPDMEKQTASKLGREAIYCHPAYLTYMQSTSCKILGWRKHKLESRLLGEISITSDMQMTPPLW